MESQPFDYAADSIVTLYSLPNFSPATPLTKTKTALSFGLFTAIQHDTPEQPKAEGIGARNKGVPVVITYLAVGCRRKLVLYTWKDGEPQDTTVRPPLRNHCLKTYFLLLRKRLYPIPQGLWPLSMAKQSLWDIHLQTM